MLFCCLILNVKWSFSSIEAADASDVSVGLLKKKLKLKTEKWGEYKMNKVFDPRIFLIPNDVVKEQK